MLSGICKVRRLTTMAMSKQNKTMSLLKCQRKCVPAGKYGQTTKSEARKARATANAADPVRK
jgi:hypothetical protein